MDKSIIFWQFIKKNIEEFIHNSKYAEAYAKYIKLNQALRLIKIENRHTNLNSQQALLYDRVKVNSETYMT